MPASADRRRLGSISLSPQVAVVIVTHNDLADAEKMSLPALLGDGKPAWMDVVVVDNASREDANELLGVRYPVVRILSNRYNHGFARAVNAGIRSVPHNSHILLLNPDAVLDHDGLTSMLRFLEEKPRAGVVAPRLYNPDGTIQNTARSFPSIWTALVGRRSAFLRWFPDNPISRQYLLDRSHASAEPFRVDWVSGACMLIRREALSDVGLLDEGFFIYWEDADWCHRAADRGWEVYCLPAISAVHRQGGAGISTARVTWRFHRSALRYYTKHHASARWATPLAAAALFVRALLCLVTALPTYIIRRHVRAHSR